MRKRYSRKTSTLFPSPMPSDVTGGRTTKGRERQDEGGLRKHVLWPTPTQQQPTVIHQSPNGGPPQNLRIAVLESMETSETSTEPPTGERLYLPAGFLASHFPRPGSAEARQMTVTSGLRCTALLENRTPLGSLRRMLLESSRWNSTTCFLTWKVKATPSNRLLFQLAPLMPDTDETEFGLWATATEQDSANDGGPSQYERHSLPLNAEVKMWPTPRHEGFDAGKHRGVPDSLHSAVKLWPTVSANNQKGGTTGLNGGSGAGAKLLEIVGRKEQLLMSGGSLNPTWVEWLMGYPTGWTALKDWATRLSRRSRMKS